MTVLFTLQYHWLWAAAMALALFFPVRRLIWVLQLRRAERERPVDDEQRRAIKRRAGVTAVLLSFVFSYFYTASLLAPAP